MQKILIAGLDSQSFGIGFHGKLLYKHKLDMKRFRSLTLDGCVLMGHNTYKSIGYPLDKRFNIIVSRSLQEISTTNMYFVNSIEKGEEIAQQRGHKKLYILGGGEI